MKVLIVDDEKPGRERLRRLMGEINPEAELVEAADGKAALNDMRRQPADIVLLDIRLPGMDGLEIAEHLCQWRPAPAVIFTTAFEQHALRAFNTHAIAYLLKPIARDKLADALQQAGSINRAQLNSLRQDAGTKRSHISGRCGDALLLVPIEDIRYFKTKEKYVEAAWPDGTLLIDESLAALAQEFSDQFVRAHRNALIAHRHVCALEKTVTGWSVRFTGMDGSIPVSRRLVSDLRTQLRSA